MVAQRNRAAPAEGARPEDWPQLVRFAILLVSVGGVLLLGAALRTTSPLQAGVEGAPATAADTVHAPPPPAALASPAPVRADDTPSSRRSLDPLAARAAADLDRLASAGEGWTAQLAALCDPARVEAMVARFGSHPALHVLPWVHENRSCFRICWNRYPTRDGAERASDLPRALRELQPNPLPKSIDEVVE